MKDFDIFDIREIDGDNEKLCTCISCNESSVSINVDAMYEITLLSKKICICDVCKEKLKATL